MLSIKGTFQKGAAQPLEPVAGHEGQPVIITFLDEGSSQSPASTNEAGWEEMAELMESCMIETGISDLAHQHDHYLYGKSKKA
jgi:hypothetical protein